MDEATVFTAQERDAWDSLSDTASKLMQLPILHEMQGEEYAHMLHALQRAVLSRPLHRALIESGEATPTPDPDPIGIVCPDPDCGIHGTHPSPMPGSGCNTTVRAGRSL